MVLRGNLCFHLVRVLQFKKEYRYLCSREPCLGGKANFQYEKNVCNTGASFGGLPYEGVDYVLDSVSFYRILGASSRHYKKLLHQVQSRGFKIQVIAAERKET